MRDQDKPSSSDAGAPAADQASTSASASASPTASASTSAPADLRRVTALQWLARLRQRVTLNNDTDIEKTTQRITDGIRIDGEAPWMLVCSALLASIGLDVNSTAVIIGAMLISPLMSPILGIGLGIGVADRRLLMISGRELGFAALVSLVTSTLYFAISPLGEPTSELLARTTPTLLDVGVAFFGGVAGIVAGSRKETSLALPGVAIATALMPPICTAGFGLATGRISFFLGASYLFVLNAMFIALSTTLIVRALHFPLRTYETREARRRAMRVIGGVATVAIVPSLWFLYTTVQGQRESQRVDQFVQQTVAARGHDVLRWDRQQDGDSTVLKIFIAGRPLDEAALDSVLAARAQFGLQSMRILPVQSDVSGEDLDRMASDLRTGVLQMIAGSQETRDSLSRIQHTRDSLLRLSNPLSDSVHVRMVARHLASAFPEIASVAWVPIANLLDSGTVKEKPFLQVSFRPDVTRTQRTEILKRVEALARSEFGSDSVRVIVR
jgi:uncharacterized hydrophobic protein (TIGR00271 family)